MARRKFVEAKSNDGGSPLRKLVASIEGLYDIEIAPSISVSRMPLSYRQSGVGSIPA